MNSLGGESGRDNRFVCVTPTLAIDTKPLFSWTKVCCVNTKYSKKGNTYFAIRSKQGFISYFKNRAG